MLYICDHIHYTWHTEQDNHHYMIDYLHNLLSLMQNKKKDVR